MVFCIYRQMKVKYDKWDCIDGNEYIEINRQILVHAAYYLWIYQFLVLFFYLSFSFQILI